MTSGPQRVYVDLVGVQHHAGLEPGVKAKRLPHPVLHSFHGGDLANGNGQRRLGFWGVTAANKSVGRATIIIFGSYRGHLFPPAADLVLGHSLIDRLKLPDYRSGDMAGSGLRN